MAQFTTITDVVADAQLEGRQVIIQVGDDTYYRVVGSLDKMIIHGITWEQIINEKLEPNELMKRASYQGHNVVLEQINFNSSLYEETGTYFSMIREPKLNLTEIVNAAKGYMTTSLLLKIGIDKTEYMVIKVSAPDTQAEDPSILGGLPAFGNLKTVLPVYLDSGDGTKANIGSISKDPLRIQSITGYRSK